MKKYFSLITLISFCTIIDAMDLTDAQWDMLNKKYSFADDVTLAEEKENTEKRRKKQAPSKQKNAAFNSAPTLTTPQIVAFNSEPTLTIPQCDVSFTYHIIHKNTRSTYGAAFDGSPTLENYIPHSLFSKLNTDTTHVPIKRDCKASLEDITDHINRDEESRYRAINSQRDIPNNQDFLTNIRKIDRIIQKLSKKNTAKQEEIAFLEEIYGEPKPQVNPETPELTINPETPKSQVCPETPRHPVWQRYPDLPIAQLCRFYNNINNGAYTEAIEVAKEMNSHFFAKALLENWDIEKSGIELPKAISKKHFKKAQLFLHDSK